MQPTSFQTINVNAIGANNPTQLTQAGPIVQRVLVRNVGPTLIFIASNRGDVDPQKGPSTGTYRLPPGASDVFVLVPNQPLLALAVGAGAQLSMSISEALPLEFMKV